MFGPFSVGNGLSGRYPHQNDGIEIADENMTLIADMGHIWPIFGRIGHMNLKLAIFGLNSLSENGSKYQKSEMLKIYVKIIMTNLNL